MGNVTKKLASRFPRDRRPDLLFFVLLAATAWLLAFYVFDLKTYLGETESWRQVVSEDWSVNRILRPVLQSRLFQTLVVLLGWSFWLRRRHLRLDQSRLRRSEQNYRSIINHAAEAIFLLDAGGRVREWNKAAENLFGEPRRAVLNRPFREVHLCYGFEIDKAMADVKRLHRSLTFEFPFPRAGRQHGQISLTISAIDTAHLSGTKKEDAFVVLARDITSEKQLESKMSETEKLAGIGQLAAGIAHQLNTPLGSILLSAQMLEDTIEDEDQVEDVRRIIRQTNQCRTIIKGLLNFARPTGKERRNIHLAEVIRETIYLLEKSIKLAEVNVKVHEETDPIVYGNRNELDQVFFNLLANALDAMPGGGDIDIVLRDGSLGEVMVEFSDQGEGIPADMRERVFLPFVTTKEYGKGTGLGLSIVARIVHEHGGRIQMQSEAGQGTRFMLSFPRPGFGLERDDGGNRKE